MQPRMSNDALGLRPQTEANQEEGVATASKHPSCQGLSLRAEITGAVGHAIPKEAG